MANVHVSGSGNPNLTVGGTSNARISTGNTTMPKYVGARAVVDRVEEGVRITLSDYQGTTQEIVAEAIEDITTNADGSLTFVLPNNRSITTESLTGPAGVGIASIAKTGTSGLVDTYTITYTDGTTTTYTVTNGQDGVGAVTDVEVDGVSVVTDGVAGIDLSGKADVADIPSKVSDLTNDSGFITLASVPTKTSDLTNDSGFITSADVPQEIFWATYGTTTSAEIESAYQAGEIVCAIRDSMTYTLDYRANATIHYFHMLTNNTVHRLSCINNAWAEYTTYLAPLDANEKIDDYYLPDYHDIYWATYGTTTTAEIVQAILSEKYIFVEYGARIYALSKINGSTSHDFACFESGVEYRISCNDDVWTASQVRFVPLDSNNKIAASYLPIYNGGVTP